MDDVILVFLAYLDSKDIDIQLSEENEISQGMYYFKISIVIEKMRIFLAPILTPLQMLLELYMYRHSMVCLHSILRHRL